MWARIRAGPHCFKYGVTTNFITGLDVVLAGGRRVQLGGHALDYPEYDFTGLVNGSEGTLVQVVGVIARLLRNPPAVKTMMAAFDSLQAAGEAVSAVIAGGLVPATLEMMDQNMMRIIEDFIPAGLPVDRQAALIVEVDGYPDSLMPQMQEIEAILRRQNAMDIRLAASEAEREQIWYGRKSAFGAMARLAPAYLVLDGTVPRSKLAATLGAVDRICSDKGLRVANVFHAGDGNLHPLILIDDPADEQLLEHVHHAGRQIMELCVEQGGSISGEHGIGIEKRDYMPLMFSGAELAAMWDVKTVFDPECRFNPDKIFPTDYAPQAEIESETDNSAGAAPDGAVFPESAQDAARIFARLQPGRTAGGCAGRRHQGRTCARGGFADFFRRAQGSSGARPGRSVRDGGCRDAAG